MSNLFSYPLPSQGQNFSFPQGKHPREEKKKYTGVPILKNAFSKVRAILFSAPQKAEMRDHGDCGNLRGDEKCFPESELCSLRVQALLISTALRQSADCPGISIICW